MLDSADETQDFLQTPAFSLRAAVGESLETEGPTVGSLRREPLEGRRIGPYRIERLLGRGGMGAVYLAVRIDEFEKHVALKILKRGMNTAAIARRFRHERQILAHLDHPNIAKLLDGGTTEDGVPYFVMEYVEGENIDRYCDRHRLTVRQRLELFRKVCSAVHLAHQNLVVHRDLKPGNILVGTDGEPKLLDFGIAKPLDAPDSSEADSTASGMHSMTLAYASPEQVGGEAITTASDVYSLGVVLYELLTGQRPYRSPGHKWLELAQAIREQTPRRPSAAVLAETQTFDVPKGTDPSEERRRAAHLRGLKRRLAGDLDSILLTALAKQPERRYASVEQLSEDVHRHLEGLPINARKLTFAYWTGKFVRRHKLETLMAAVVLAAIVGFSFIAVELQNRAAQEQNRAALEQGRAEEVAEFLVEVFQAPGPDQAKGRDITALELLDRGKERIKKYSDSQPRLYARLAITMGKVYYDLGLYDDGVELLEEAIRELQPHLDDEAKLQLASLLNNLAVSLRGQGRLAEAEARLRESLAIRIRLLGNNAPEIVTTLNNIATLVRDQGGFAEAEELYRRALDIRLGLDPPVPEDVATSQSLLGGLLLDIGDYRGAEALLRSALETRQELLGAWHTKVALVLTNLAIALQAQGEIAESETRYRKALEIRQKLLDEHHPDIAVTETSLASLLAATGRFEEAEELARHALETFHVAKPGHWRIAVADSVLGSCLAEKGRFEEAERLMREGYPTLVAARRECTRYTIEASQRLLAVYEAWGKPERTAKIRSDLDACTDQQQKGLRRKQRSP